MQCSVYLDYSIGGVDNIYLYMYMVRRVRPLRFVAHERLTKNAGEYLVPTLLSSGCEISLGMGLGVRCVYMCTYVTCSYVRSCSVEYDVDELYGCTLSTGSLKGEQLCKALILRRDDRLCRAREEAGTLRPLIVSGPQGNYFLLEEKRLKDLVLECTSYSLHVSCVLSARILDLHTTQD